MSKKSVEALDSHIGARLRTLRLRHELSLENVGEVLDVSAQQVSRYELGQHRLSAAQLFRLARALSVPVSWFFLGFEEDDSEIKRLQLVMQEQRGEWRLHTREDEQKLLLDAWRGLANEKQRSAVLQLLDAFSSSARK